MDIDEFDKLTPEQRSSLTPEERIEVLKKKTNKWEKITGEFKIFCDEYIKNTLHGVIH